MIYKIKYHPQVCNDLRSLDKNICNKVLKKIGQLSEKPYMGHLLGNKAGLDLTGYRKLYADKQRIRVVYRVDEERLTVMILAVGKRDDLYIYKLARQRLTAEDHSDLS